MQTVVKVTLIGKHKDHSVEIVKKKDQLNKLGPYPSESSSIATHEDLLVSQRPKSECTWRYYNSQTIRFIPDCICPSIHKPASPQKYGLRPHHLPYIHDS